MTFMDDQLNDIYDRTSGRCHICGGELAFRNYGVRGFSGAWEVEHSNPQVNGGTHRLSNLYAAHIGCNRSKGASSTKYARSRYGRTKAPLSFSKREAVRVENTFVIGTAGAFIGSRLGGVHGAIFGAALGALLGNSVRPD